MVYGLPKIVHSKRGVATSSKRFSFVSANDTDKFVIVFFWGGGWCNDKTKQTSVKSVSAESLFIPFFVKELRRLLLEIRKGGRMRQL